MDCSTVRELIEDEQASGAVAAHLAQCASCRAEMQFHERMVAAVAGWPRMSAPEALTGRIMAELRAASPARSPARRLPRIVLRPWEAGWIGAACLLLIAFLFLLPGRWGLSLTASAVNALHGGVDSLANSLGGLGGIKLDPAYLVREFHDWIGAAGSIPVAWLFAASGFGIALVWLLARHAEIEPRRGWEDAHA